MLLFIICRKTGWNDYKYGMNCEVFNCFLNNIVRISINLYHYILLSSTINDLSSRIN